LTPRYHEAAEEELLAQVRYLDDRAPGLGRRLLDEIERAEALIVEFPESAEEIRPGIRRRLVRTFRCALIYTVEPDGILILAVAARGRRPAYWSVRAPGSL
jgi:hypothetical protein